MSKKCSLEKTAKNLKLTAPKFSSHLHQVLYSIQTLEKDSKCGICTASITKFMKKTFLTDGDVTSQVRTTLARAQCQGLIFKNDHRWFLSVPIAKTQLRKLSIQANMQLRESFLISSNIPTRKSSRYSNTKTSNNLTTGVLDRVSRYLCGDTYSGSGDRCHDDKSISPEHPILTKKNKLRRRSRSQSSRDDKYTPPVTRSQFKKMCSPKKVSNKQNPKINKRDYVKLVQRKSECKPKTKIRKKATKKWRRKPKCYRTKQKK